MMMGTPIATMTAVSGLTGRGMPLIPIESKDMAKLDARSAIDEGGSKTSTAIGLFFSPVFQLDAMTQQVIFQYRENGTGAVERQYPSKEQIEQAYQETLTGAATGVELDVIDSDRGQSVPAAGVQTNYQTQKLTTAIGDGSAVSQVSDTGNAGNA